MGSGHRAQRGVISLVSEAIFIHVEIKINTGETCVSNLAPCPSNILFPEQGRVGRLTLRLKAISTGSSTPLIGRLLF